MTRALTRGDTVIRELPRRGAMTTAVMAALFFPCAAAAFCPSYTKSSTSNTHNCDVDSVNGTNPTVDEWLDIIDTVSGGPEKWSAGGPSAASIGQGCGKPEPLKQVPAKFPCELLYGIAMQESGWRQFCVPTTPSDQVGGASRTIISFDCGYGVSQVTSGMRSTDPAPTYDRIKVAGDALYNLATGASILAGKWRATNCVGDNQPTTVEHWYSATWAYNGLAYKNSPNNPEYSSSRGVWDPSVGNPAPYQEKVFGWIENPPSGRWQKMALAYPDLADVGGASSPGTLPEPTCASPTDCVNTRNRHRSRCFPEPELDAGVPDAGSDPEDAGTEQEEDAGVADSGVPSEPIVPADPIPIIPTEPSVNQAQSVGCGCSAASASGLWLLVLVLIGIRRSTSRDATR